MSDCPGVATDVLKQELEKARLASRRPPIDVELVKCRKFILRSEKRVAELEAERSAEISAPQEAMGRLQRLEAEQAAATNLPEPSAPSFSSADAEIVALKAKLVEVEGERDAAIRNQSNKRPATMFSVASARADQPMPVTRVPRELSSVSGCRHVTRSWDKHWSRETRPK